MLREIIYEILSESNDNINIDSKADKVLAEIKDTAKGIFFSGKIIALKDFIFDIPNHKNEEIRSKLIENLTDLVDDNNKFIYKLKQKIQENIESRNLDKNLDSLLDMLDYGHLKDMLKMFKL